MPKASSPAPPPRSTSADWIPALAGATLDLWRVRPADEPQALARSVSEWLVASRVDDDDLPAVRRVALPRPAMGRMRWPVPAIASAAELAAFLDVHPRELDWLADPRGWERTAADERLRHYRYGWLVRPGSPPRVVERPKRLLKDVQRRILRAILDSIPPHAAAHGFRRGHSVLTHARLHTRRRVVLRFDLEAFFASLAAGRVYGIFRSAGYPEAVAYALTALCTNVVAREAWERVPVPADPRQLAAHRRLGQQLAVPHLPQGAPTSPALANLCAYRLDARLAGLAARFGATYSRYADDLTLSGDGRLLAAAPAVRRAVTTIVADEGFRLNERKSRLMTSAGRQHVCGVVVNERPGVPRPELDRLRATLHEAALHGPAAANRARVPDFRAHLLGRIGWVEQLDPRRGERLRRRFATIDFGDEGGA